MMAGAPAGENSAAENMAAENMAAENTSGAGVGRTLVAGIGNIFLSDDGFGVEVAARLAETALPDDVRVVDYGIRGMHLAYDLAGGYDTAILVDATPRGGAPGTIYVIEPEFGSGAADASPGAARYGEPADSEVASPLLDAHGMQPDVVLGMLDMLGGGRPGRILVVGCEPASVDYGMGLSEVVAAAVAEAAAVVVELVTGGNTAFGTQGADARSKLFTEGWTHVPRHSG
jgi:hydrogenase maturation protease